MAITRDNTQLRADYIFNRAWRRGIDGIGKDLKYGDVGYVYIVGFVKGYYNLHRTLKGNCVTNLYTGTLKEIEAYLAGYSEGLRNGN